MRRTIIDTTNLELTDKVVSIKRVTKVVKGGRNMRFTALVVVGDGNGHVGVGLGKSIEIPEAIRKGKEDAMKSLISVPIDQNDSIPYDIIGKFGSAEVCRRDHGLIKEETKMAEKNLKITLVKSPIGAVPKHRATVEAMGLTKMHKTVIMPDNASTRGMIQKVGYMLKVEEA